MKFDDLLLKYTKQPFIDLKGVALLFNESINQVQVQFSRFVDAGKLFRIRNSIYIFSEKYRQLNVNSFYLSAYILQPSYISLEKALEYYGLIPENVYVVTALTTKRANSFSNIVGDFSYRHIQEKLFFGYVSMDESFPYFIAYPEKALLDYVYVNRLKVTIGMVEELRLQNLDVLDINKLRKFSVMFANKNIDKFVLFLEDLILNGNRLKEL
ncbi:MAG: hypothetical protein PHF25_00160 [Candidatus Margulisbacteria bacterium]|nr:hypothetical protein [Candidatus Margulisiibacteriota bacterium]